MRGELVLLIASSALCTNCGHTAEDIPEVAGEGDAASDAATTAACESDGWRRFDAKDYFSFRAPCSLSGGPVKGLDSFVGEYNDTGLRIVFDYGAYSSPLTEWEDYEGYAKQPLVLDGRDAYIVTVLDADPSSGLPLVGGIHVPSVDGGSASLTMYGSADTLARRDIYISVMKTIDFP